MSAELDALGALRDEVFDAFGHRSHASLPNALSDRSDLLVLRAGRAAAPVGFSAGYRRSPTVYYLNYVAVREGQRGQGVGSALVREQETFARSRGYRQIEFNTFNHFPGMLRLALWLGFRPVGVEQHAGTNDALAVRFAKTLQTPASEDDLREIERVRAAVVAGARVCGMQRDEATGVLQTILTPAL